MSSSGGRRNSGLGLEAPGLRGDGGGELADWTLIELGGKDGCWEI